jgi:CRISPR/Cas system CSM-associated protein Csm5 (group 7 of RAMP superfamily)
MIESTIKGMIRDLQKYKGHTKEELLLQNVSERLNKSLESYNKELEQSIKYLAKKNELRMIRKINKL